MNQFSKINIKAKLSAKPLLLFSIWLMLIIIPFLILSYTIDCILKESEERLLTKSKIQIIEDVREFQSNLNPCWYIDSKLSKVSNFNENAVINAEHLENSISNLTKSKISALFYYDITNDLFDYYIEEALEDEFGMRVIPNSKANQSENTKKELGKYNIQNLKKLLLYYASNDNNENTGNKSVVYFQTLLNAAGGINLKKEKAIPILSGKEKLGRLIAYFKPINQKDSEKQQVMLFLFKESNIPLNEIIKNASSINRGNNCIREIVSLHLDKKQESSSNNLPFYEDEPFFKFQHDSKELSIISTVPEDILIRLGTQNTYYPLKYEQLIKNKPFLKVAINNSYLEHPMRKVINKLRFPTLLLILLATFGLIKLAIYGYITNIRILLRVILCVLGAVVLPFSSFIIATYYNQYFDEEYSENELQHYTLIQTEFLNKAIKAYLENLELSISKLQKDLYGQTDEQLNKILIEWLNENGASIISYYNYKTENESLIKDETSDEHLSSFAKEFRSYIDIGLKNSFNEIDISKVNSIPEIGIKYFGNPDLLPNLFDVVLNNTSKLYPYVKNDPTSIYCLFPIYENEKKANKVIGSVFIKFNTFNLLSNLKKRRSSMFHKMTMGNYEVSNAIIPVNDDGQIPTIDKMLLTPGFSLKSMYQKLNEIISNKSQKNWITNDTINSAFYLNIVNALIVSKAEKVSSSNSMSSLNINTILIYIVLMIASLSIILCGIIVSPIRKLQKASEKIAQGDYSDIIEWKSGDEFENLCNGFNNMTEALLQKEKMTNYVSKEVINEVSSNIEQQLQPSGERIPVSVLFCALKGKKPLSDYSPDEVTKVISCLIDAVDEISSNLNGQIDKLIEDTVMVVFRKVNNNDNIVLNACRTALAINYRLKKELPDFEINMGIASGDAVSGKIGSRNGKLDYTVIGNPVNLAARLKVQAYKAKNTGILLCPFSIRQLHGAGHLNFIERMTIKGRTNRTFPLYELIGLRDL